MSVAAGWYPDPAEPSTQRYWDGEQWVGGAVPVGVEPPAVPPPSVLPTVAPSLVTATPAAEVAAPPLEPVHPPHAAGAPADALAGMGLEGVGPLPQLAGPLLRLVARLIDITVVGVLALLVNGYFIYRHGEVAQQLDQVLKSGGSTQDRAQVAQALRLIVVMIATTVGLWFAYEVPATANTGQTLGKRLVGVRVQRLDGHNLTLWQSFRRWFILALPSILLQSLGLPLQLVDCAWCTWDKPLQQCLHDKPVQSVVVRGGPNSSTPPQL